MENESRIVLFRTLVGSHLYGLAHSNSDIDYFEVVTRLPHVKNTSSRYANQTIRDGVDITRVDITSFLNSAAKGVPQFLEAMWSRSPEIDRIREFRGSFRVGTAVLPTYLRTIKNFSKSEEFKRRRHALRLALNAQDILHRGWFNPTLDPGDASYITFLANQDVDIEQRCLDLIYREASL